MKLDVIKKCHGCDIGKMRNHPFTNVRIHSKEILALIHTDLCGPMKVQSMGKARYFLIFVDDYSRKTFVYFIRNKNDTEATIKEFITLVEREPERTLRLFEAITVVNINPIHYLIICVGKGLLICSRHRTLHNKTELPNGPIELSLRNPAA